MCNLESLQQMLDIIIKNLLNRISLWFDDLEGTLFQQQQQILCTLGILPKNNDKPLSIRWAKVLVTRRFWAINSVSSPARFLALIHFPFS